MSLSKKVWGGYYSTPPKRISCQNKEINADVLRIVLESWNWFSEHFCVFLPKSCHQNGVRLPKTFFSSINSFKRVLIMDVRAKTTFVADFGNYCCFFSNMDTKVAWQKFLASGPSGGKKNTTFRKKVGFFDQLEYSPSYQGSAQCQKFLQDPKISEFKYFSAFM